jgi:Predicted transcriptional regulator
MNRIELPQAEFEVMEIIWKCPPPVTTVQIMAFLTDKNWKMPTLISLINRLITRGFVKSEKSGRERLYYPLIHEEEYMRNEVKSIIQKYNKPSVTGLISALYSDEKISNAEKEELIEWLRSK